MLAVTIGGGYAKENDPEGTVQRDSDGKYRYYVATTSTQIQGSFVVGYEEDYYAADGGYWQENNMEFQDRASGYGGSGSSSGIESDEASTDSSNFSNDIPTTAPPSSTATSTGGRNKPKSKANDYKIGHSSRGGTVRGGAAGGSNHRRPQRHTAKQGNR